MPTVGHVLRRVAERFNVSCERWRELGVYEEAQSCAPQDGMIVLPCCELQDCGDVVCFEIRIVRQDLFPRRTRSEELEHVLHTDTEAPNTRAATAHIRRHRDSIQGTHISSSASAAGNGDVQAARCEFDHGLHLVAVEPVVPLQDIVQVCARFKVLENRGNGHGPRRTG
jgi:hypothetical protein